jgi:hypothetical protein
MLRSMPNFAWALVAAATFLSQGSISRAQLQGMRTFENRSEGTNVHTNALQDFTLLAIRRNFQPFTANSTLHVRFFLPRTVGNLDKKVFVEANELQDSFHYFMQATARKWSDGAWNVFGPWPTGDVIDRLQIQYANVGVRAGYRISNGPEVFVPVDVYQNDGQPATQAYTFYFISGSDLQSLDVSVANSAGAVMKSPSLQKSRCLNG